VRDRSTRLDGTRAAATSARRNRAVLFNALQYAAEFGLVDASPIKDLRWTAPRASQAIDRRRVINPDQARALLAAVEAQEPSGLRLVAFFGVMYYRGLRPEGAAMLRMADLRLRADKDEWGKIQLTAAAPVTEKQQVSERFAQAGEEIG
jgi:site-specific recombinase XerD